MESNNFLELRQNENKELAWLIANSAIESSYEDCKIFVFRGKLRYSFAINLLKNNWLNRSNTNAEFFASVLNCGMSYNHKTQKMYFSYTIAA